MSNQEANSLAGEYNTAVLYDAARRLGLETGIQSVMPVAKGLRVQGPAYTVKFTSSNQPPSKPLNFYDIMNTVPKGHVLVFGVGADRWILGGNMSLFAQLSGIAGLVMDGCVRDIADIRERGYPIFARGASVTGYSRELALNDTGCDILCGNITVATGDIIVGDDDGVVSLPASRLPEILYEAQEISQLDAKLESDIKARRSLAELHATRVKWSVRRSPK